MPELNTAPLGDLFLGAHDKTLFSMVIPPVTALLKKHDFKSIVLLGIEVSPSTHPTAVSPPDRRSSKTLMAMMIYL